MLICCIYVLFFRNYCLHDPTSNADFTYCAKIKFSFIQYFNENIDQSSEDKLVLEHWQKQWEKSIRHFCQHGCLMAKKKLG